jgi:peptidoglycan/LPS O-acetylase OafA/YrhL
VGPVRPPRLVPIPFELDRSTLVGYAIGGAYGNAISGPAAAIVFFVISGFCIHYPFRNGAPIPLKVYYSSRYARVLIPMAAAIALGFPLGLELGLLTDSILWSIVCEEIYYLLYPALLRLRHAFGIRRLVAVAFVLGLLVVVVRDPSAKNYPSYGFALNWVLGLPCWPPRLRPRGGHAGRRTQPP